MAEIIRIEDIAAHAGEQVTLQGWLQLKTGKGKLQFLRVRDGTGFIQAVIFKGNVSEEVFEAAKRMPLESSLIVTGNVRADERAPGIPGGFELDVTDLQVVQESEEYPIAPKEHGVEFLMDNRHLWLRSTRQWAILRVRATHHQGHARLAGRQRLHPGRHADPHAVRGRRARRRSSRPIFTAKTRSWRRPASSTTRPTSSRSAGCTASGRPSAPRRARRAATSRSSGWSSRRSRSASSNSCWRSKSSTSATSCRRR